MSLKTPRARNWLLLLEFPPTLPIAPDIWLDTLEDFQYQNFKNKLWRLYPANLGHWNYVCLFQMNLSFLPPTKHFLHPGQVPGPDTAKRGEGRETGMQGQSCGRFPESLLQRKVTISGVVVRSPTCTKRQNNSKFLSDGVCKKNLFFFSRGSGGSYDHPNAGGKGSAPLALPNLFILSFHLFVCQHSLLYPGGHKGGQVLPSESTLKKSAICSLPSLHY